MTRNKSFSLCETYVWSDWSRSNGVVATLVVRFAVGHKDRVGAAMPTAQRTALAWTGLTRVIVTARRTRCCTTPDWSSCFTFYLNQDRTIRFILIFIINFCFFQMIDWLPVLWDWPVDERRESVELKALINASRVSWLLATDNGVKPSSSAEF